MSVAATLAALRAGRVPGPGMLAEFARGLADGTVSDAQAGAFAMGVCRGPGLGEAGRTALTRAMAESGSRLDWDLPGPVVDKHSTGGVGDPVSLILAPALACLGCHVPMISGRGLGHTGGTLDKLEAIPGLSVEMDGHRLRDVVDEVGCAIVAAGAGIAPADRRLYAVRDVTATVDQIDLITASILSKKLAAGLGALVLDVKLGSGAFMRGEEEAEALAFALVATACGAGCPAAALLTAMDQPLAPAIGNAVEIRAVLDVLTGRVQDGPLERVTLELGAAVLVLAGAAADREAGRARMLGALRTGAAAERFGRMVAAQGGPRELVERPEAHLPTAPVTRDVLAERTGRLAAIDGRRLGEAVVALGGGRARETDRIDPSVGLSHVARLGEQVTAGDVLARVHAGSDEAALRAERSTREAMTVRDAPPEPRPLILARLP